MALFRLVQNVNKIHTHFAEVIRSKEVKKDIFESSQISRLSQLICSGSVFKYFANS